MSGTLSLLRCLVASRAGLSAAILGILLAMATRSWAEPPAEPADENQSKRLLEMYLTDARALTVYGDAGHQHKLGLREKPVYIWQNRIRSDGQYGAVYVWTDRGCPEIVGTIFSNPNPRGDGRSVLHEFHAVSSRVLYPVGDPQNIWSPRQGIERQPIADAPQPAESPKSRLVQLRSLARDFSAHSISPYDDSRWELRLLPQPLYRYESSDPDVVDGAVFAYVTSAGTDPEVLLLLEARRSGEKPQWQFAAARFSDFNLFVEYKGNQVWQALRDDANPWGYNKERTYRLYTDRIIEE
ncbi:MAG TPA: hypothetical protein VHC22_14565 [Pirellulales bacterium]|nr:hypothetical protein [Pirellulales bacterium]